MKLVFENTELVSIKEACEIFGISRMTLHRWIVKGKIQAVQVGEYRAIPKTEIERLRDV